MRATTRRAGLGVAVVLLLAGCASDAGPPLEDPLADPPTSEALDDDPGTDERTHPSEPDATEPGPLAFTGRSLDGGTIDASQYAGSHTVLWMWTPW